ncbi:MobV family relaxase [Paracoccus sp. (in: a-proteobacteria)]|uniref:MobV family relaxase n=1 Tax=Paracoccus sp. TaxID=267 RepID=UPI00321F6F4F
MTMLIADLDDLFRRRGGPAFKGFGKSFAIMRVAKIKTLGNMGASLQHTFRERETPNADPRRLTENTVLAGPDTAHAVLDTWHRRAPEKIRKNAVHGLEYFVGGSPEAMRAMTREQQDAYFADALAWLQKRHGAENILSAVVHRDEITPHMTVMTIPLDARGKLNARSFVGSRKDLSELQTGFAAEVGAAYGLERGQIRSTATHERVKRVYGYMQDPPMAVALPERGTGGLLGLGGESEQKYRERVSAGLTEGLTGIVLRQGMAERKAKDQIDGLTRQLDLAERQAADNQHAFDTLAGILAAYEASGRTQELVDTVYDYKQAQQAAHERQQAGIEAERQRQLHELTRRQELDHERRAKALRKEQKLAADRRRDRGLDLDL